MWTLAVDSLLQFWATINRCKAKPIELKLADTVRHDSSTVNHIVHGICDSGRTVEHYKVVGGGHTWPGSGMNYPNTNYDIEASAEIWRFFEVYDIDGRR